MPSVLAMWLSAQAGRQRPLLILLLFNTATGSCRWHCCCHFYHLCHLLRMRPLSTNATSIWIAFANSHPPAILPLAAAAGGIAATSTTSATLQCCHLLRMRPLSPQCHLHLDCFCKFCSCCHHHLYCCSWHQLPSKLCHRHLNLHLPAASAHTAVAQWRYLAKCYAKYTLL